MNAGSGITTSTPGIELVGEADAEVDHQPLAGRAVEIEVHADLAGPAQGQEQQLVVRRERSSTVAPPDLQQAERHQVGLDKVEQSRSRPRTRWRDRRSRPPSWARRYSARMRLIEALDQPDIAPEDARRACWPRWSCRSPCVGLLDPDARQAAPSSGRRLSIVSSTPGAQTRRRRSCRPCPARSEVVALPKSMVISGPPYFLWPAITPTSRSASRFLPAGRSAP